MPISSVSSTPPAAAQAVQPPKARQDQTQQTDSSRPADDTARTRPAEDRQKAPEQPKPVVNAEGQITGQVINVTA